VRAAGAEREHRIDVYRRAYHAAVEDADERVGEILAALDPYRNDTLVVVTSDHGEMLGDRGRLGHGPNVYEPLTRVPLIAVGAGSLPARLTGAAIPDLLTEALGVEHPWSVRVADSDLLVSQRGGLVAVSPDGKVKGIWRRRGSLKAFEIATYPESERRLAAKPGTLEKARERFLADVPEGKIEGTVPVRVDDETLEALRALGYVGEEPEQGPEDDEP
jgi:membrane-anchored protein YejM (alkaline phosphatase superfamily)